jgi:hypothetical protein
VSGQLHSPAALSPGAHWIEGRVGPRAGVEDVEKRTFLTLPGLEPRPLNRPDRSQSLYRVHYTDSWCKCDDNIKINLKEIG